MLNIVLADTDEAYADMFGTYLGKKCRGKAEVYVFTVINELLEHLGKADSVSILIAAPEFINEIGIENNIGVKFVLSDKKPENQPENGASYILFKYRPAAALLEEVMLKYGETDTVELGHIFKGERKTKIITVHSACGSSGKTLSSLALSIQLARHGCKILYMNFETISSLHYYLDEKIKHTENMSSLLYYLRQDICKLPLKLDTAVCDDTLTGISYLENAGCAFELCELTAAEILRFLTYIKNAGRFDTVVFDGDAGLNDLLPSLFLQSDMIVYVLTDDTFSEYRQKIFESELHKHPAFQSEVYAGKFIYVLNKWKKDRRQSYDQLAGNVFRVPVSPDILLHSGRCGQLNLESSFIKAFEAPASFVGSKIGMIFPLKTGTEI